MAYQRQISRGVSPHNISIALHINRARWDIQTAIAFETTGVLALMKTPGVLKYL
jgi:hypothetical protein